MTTHDIIDNRSEKLVDHINRMLDSTEFARFAVGYFFLSGLESIAERLDGVKELRLLIGNTTNRETLEQLAEGYRRLELVQDAIEAQTYPKRTEMARMANETATNIRSAVEQMDQSDQSEILVKDRMEGEDARDILWDDEITQRLADFQKVAVRQAVQIIRDFGGAFVADVVGLGKSYIGTAIVKHFERTEHARPLIICPAPLVEMWERANELYQLNARVLSMGYLRGEDDGTFNYLLKDAKYRDRDFVLIDESHNFRNPDTQRYKVVQAFAATGRQCCFLTATPRNKSAWGVYNQIKLFHQDDKTDLPVDPPILRDYFRLIEKGERKLPDLLANILIRRTRNHILRWYGYDAITHQPLEPSQFKEYLEGKKRAYVMVGGRHQFFPKRVLETIEYSIEDTYRGLYQELRQYIGKPRKGQPIQPPDDELTFARYGLWHYVVRQKQKQEPYMSMQRAGSNLRGLIRILLFKRFESSVYAFKETVRRLLRVHKAFLEALRQGLVPAGEDAQNVLYESDYAEETDLLDALRH